DVASGDRGGGNPVYARRSRGSGDHRGRGAHGGVVDAAGRHGAGGVRRGDGERARQDTPACYGDWCERNGCGLRTVMAKGTRAAIGRTVWRVALATLLSVL